MSTVDQETTGQIDGLQQDILSTPTLALPPTPSEVHQGKVDGVTYEEFESGASAIKFALSSDNVSGVTDELALFLPKGFAEDIHVNPADLPTGDAEGKGNQQQQYSIGIANTDGTATLQELRKIAYGQGRTLEGQNAPTNIEEFVGVLNDLLTGINVVFTRRPNKKAEDPRFRNRLRAGGIMDPATANNPKMFKKYVKMWEV